jgi:hypothetical protein
MLTYNYCADISMQNTLKAWSMTQNMTKWHFNQQVTLKVFCMAKSTHSLDVNM